MAHSYELYKMHGIGESNIQLTHDLIFSLSVNSFSLILPFMLSCLCNISFFQLSRRPYPNFMETVQQDITPSMRAILVDWLVEVCIIRLSHSHVVTAYSNFQVLLNNMNYKFVKLLLLISFLH